MPKGCPPKPFLNNAMEMSSSAFLINLKEIEMIQIYSRNLPTGNFLNKDINTKLHRGSRLLQI